MFMVIRKSQDVSSGPRLKLKKKKKKHVLVLFAEGSPALMTARCSVFCLSSANFLRHTTRLAGHYSGSDIL